MANIIVLVDQIGFHKYLPIFGNGLHLRLQLAYQSCLAILSASQYR